MTHSPTPWSTEYGRLYDANDERIEIRDEWDDAKFIATAVNAYKANQALIRQLVEALERQEYKNKWKDEALDAARKAGF